MSSEDRGVQVEARTLSGDVDPEGFMQLDGECTCGRVYAYAGHVEPGQCAPNCPTHGQEADR